MMTRFELRVQYQSAMTLIPSHIGTHYILLGWSF